jgi:hypothetical protein
MNIMQNKKVGIHETLWVPPPTLENPKKHKKHHQVYASNFFGMKKKINLILSDPYVAKYHVPIHLYRMIGMEVVRPSLTMMYQSYRILFSVVIFHD